MHRQHARVNVTGIHSTETIYSTILRRVYILGKYTFIRQGCFIVVGRQVTVTCVENILNSKLCLVLVLDSETPCSLLVIHIFLPSSVVSMWQHESHILQTLPTYAHLCICIAFCIQCCFPKTHFIIVLTCLLISLSLKKASMIITLKIVCTQVTLPTFIFSFLCYFSQQPLGMHCVL